MDAGQTLRNAREQKNLTRVRLAMMLGVSEYTISRWETGETEPDIEDVANMEHIAGCRGLLREWLVAAHPCMTELLPKKEVADTLLGTQVLVGQRAEALNSTQEQTLRDVAPDGKLDDMALKLPRTKRLEELRDAILMELEYLKRE